MKQSGIADKQQRERDEWRKGVGGIVKEVDASASTISIANAMIASGKPIVIHVSPETSILRYAPDSVKFDGAKPGTFDHVKPGDQVRARGTTGADGTEFPAPAMIYDGFLGLA